MLLVRTGERFKLIKLMTVTVSCCLCSYGTDGASFSPAALRLLSCL